MELVLELSWAPVGQSWVPFGPLGPFGGPRGPSWGSLGPSWGPLGPSWGLLGGLLGLLGAVLEASWAVLERRKTEKARKPKSFKNLRKIDDFWHLGALLGGVLEASWGVLAASWTILGVLGRSFGDSRPSWTILRTILGPSVPHGSVSAEMVPSSAGFRRRSRRGWGGVPGGPPPDPPRGTLNGNPSTRSGKSCVLVVGLSGASGRLF